MKVKQYMRNEDGVVETVYTTIRQGNGHRARIRRALAFKRLNPALPVYCCCCDEEVEMCLVMSKRGRPYLRNPRGGGPLHRITCPKYKDTSRVRPATLPAAGENPPPRENEEIELRNSTFVEAQGSILGVNDPRTNKISRQRPPCWLPPKHNTPLGLYVRLMHRAKSNVFRPWNQPVSFNAFVDGIAGQLEGLVVNDRPAVERVFIAGTGDLLSLDAVMRNYRRDEGPHAFALVYGVVDRYLTKGSNVGLFLSGVAQPIHLSAAAWRTAVAHGWYSDMRNALAASTVGQMKVHCALSVRWDGGKLIGRAPALMATTNDWIPVHSEIELHEVDRAIDEGRYFIKPIYNWKSDRFCHDLILLDTIFPFRIELCGWTGDDYLERKIVVRDGCDHDYPKGTYAFYYPGDPDIVYPQVAPRDQWHDCA